MDDGGRRAADMTARLVAAGRLHDLAWQEAFANTPRHLFVPRIFTNDPQRGWVAVADTDPGYPELAYAVDAVITQLNGDPDSWRKLRREGVYIGGWPSSSSSSPGLMALMLDVLDIAGGHHVLEIGTGTGYNAAILCHRLGDAYVTSVDIDPELIAQARDRLARLGYRPRLDALDAMTRLPDGSYDRIEVTVAVPRIPTVWITHTRPGGIILANLASGLLSDAMFRLAVDHDGTAEGHAIADAVWFMPTRDAHLPPAYELHAALDTSKHQRLTTTMPYSLTEAGAPFASLLALRFRDLQRFLTDGAPTWNWLIATDGSWIHDLGDGAIEHGGPRRLWPTIEDLWYWWRDQGEPDRSRLGLTVTADGRHHVWLDQPAIPVP
jgi:protein-L-isoaspartate O-methyltransferase